MLAQLTLPVTSPDYMESASDTVYNDNALLDKTVPPHEAMELQSPICSCHNAVNLRDSSGVDGNIHALPVSSRPPHGSSNKAPRAWRTKFWSFQLCKNDMFYIAYHGTMTCHVEHTTQ